MERAPSQVLPHTICSVERWTARNRFGDGVNKFGSIGSSVMVGRKVGVNVGTGVSVISGVPVDGVVVGSSVLSTNRSGVFVGPSENGVTVDWGGAVGVGDPRNGIEIGNPLPPDRRKQKTRTRFNFFIRPLR